MPEFDPLAFLTAPPLNETPEDKLLRQKREQEAQRVSDKIDEEIKAERAAMKKQKSVVKVLLLGQSESGKSTTLKNFRMKYARSQWKEERASWRAVIQLNLIRSVIRIVETLQREMDENSSQGTLAIRPSRSFHNISAAYNSNHAVPFAPLTNANHPSGTTNAGYSSDKSVLTEKHRLLKLRLGPLRRVEQDLRKRLGEATDEMTAASVAFGSGSVHGYDYKYDLYGDSSTPSQPNIERLMRGGIAHRDDDSELDESFTEADLSPAEMVQMFRGEFGVREWRDAVVKPSKSHSHGSPKRNGRSSSSHGRKSDVETWQDQGGDEATDVIASCKDDMQALWSDEAVQELLKEKGVRIEDSAGFFLDDLERIATRTYEPSDDDVVRARLRTLAVQEYKFQFDSASNGILSNHLGLGPSFGREWVIYDVGGSRTIRHAWLPYFDNVNAIIFLAPISCFDERLLEDPRVNRLEDSLLLWRAICTSKLLSRTTLILFLNKCDLLKRKLRSGVLVRNFLPSFGERTNDVPTVVRYLREKFKDILKQHSPEPRVSYFYATSVTDTKATATTLKTVRDSILREHLKNADFV